MKCTTPNQLFALMWMWYLNSAFQPYNYTQRLQEGFDGTSIKASSIGDAINAIA